MSTQFLGLMLMGVYFFFLCISAGFWYYGKELANAGVIPGGYNNPILGTSLDFNVLNQSFNSTVRGYQSGNAFNPALIFGDFGKGVTEFIGVVSSGYAVGMLQKLGFSQSFQQIFQVIVLGFGAAGALIYYISGRQ